MGKLQAQVISLQKCHEPGVGLVICIIHNHQLRLYRHLAHLPVDDPALRLSLHKTIGAWTAQLDLSCGARPGALPGGTPVAGSKGWMFDDEMLFMNSLKRRRK